MAHPSDNGTGPGTPGEHAVSDDLSGGAADEDQTHLADEDVAATLDEPAPDLDGNLS